LEIGHDLLNVKIRKELAENEGSTVWSERRVIFYYCVSQKKRDALGNKWELKYAEFKRCVEMPKKGTTLYNWQQNQLGKYAASLNAKIWKELSENEGSAVWSKWGVKLFDCVAQKRRE
jgi:hypothetical protein